MRLKASENRVREPREELIKPDAITTAPAAHVSGGTREVNIIHPPAVSSVDNQPVYLSSKHSWKRHTHSDKQAVHHAYAQARAHTRTYGIWNRLRCENVCKVGLGGKQFTHLENCLSVRLLQPIRSPRIMTD